MTLPKLELNTRLIKFQTFEFFESGAHHGPKLSDFSSDYKLINELLRLAGK